MANLISREAGCWIQYQLKLSGLGQKAAADESNCSVAIVSQFLCGRKDSQRVRTAPCKALGCRSFESLVKDVPQESEGGAA
ncbi:MAG: hypothetical protein LBD58_05815 [Treponema sp.]|jgi:hypothetical protein|nr:hypothetical protein [Treponema sp.]